MPWYSPDYSMLVKTRDYKKQRVRVASEDTKTVGKERGSHTRRRQVAGCQPGVQGRVAAFGRLH